MLNLCTNHGPQKAAGKGRKGSCALPRAGLLLFGRCWQLKWIDSAPCLLQAKTQCLLKPSTLNLKIHSCVKPSLPSAVKAQMSRLQAADWLMFKQNKHTCIANLCATAAPST